MRTQEDTSTDRSAHQSTHRSTHFLILSSMHSSRFDLFLKRSDQKPLKPLRANTDKSAHDRMQQVHRSAHQRTKVYTGAHTF